MKCMRWLLPAMLFAAPLTGQTVSVDQGDTITIRIVTGVDTVVVVNTVTDTIVTPPDTVVITTPPDTIVTPPDTVFVTNTVYDTVFVDVPCDCETPTDTVVTPPDTTTPPPPTDTIAPPPPPAGTLLQDWNYPDRATMYAQPDLENGGGAGNGSESRPVVLTTPGPWGGTTALENYYAIIPATGQPQVGTHWYLPDGIKEMWLDTWVRFDSSWSIYPDNPNYPGNVDHKLIFVWERDPDQTWWTHRWECKVGVWFTTMPCSAHDHDTYYQYMKSPPSNVYDPPSRLNANNAAWDGQWHRLRMHLKMGTQGRFTVWWDDAVTVDSGVMDMKSGNRWFDAITFGGNRNQGTDHPMFFQFGPAWVYTSDPGW